MERKGKESEVKRKREEEPQEAHDGVGIMHRFAVHIACKDQ